VKEFLKSTIATLQNLQDVFSFALPSVRIARHTEKFIKELTGYDALIKFFSFLSFSLVSLLILLPFLW